jgi:2-phosphoglycerate kinase
LHRSTFELVDSEGPAQFSNFDRQANAVANATVAVAQRLAAERRFAILEGVHLLPGLIGSALAPHPARPIVIERLIVECSDDAHKAKLERRAISQPLRRGDRHVADIGRIRAIQSHLQTKADASGTPTIGTENLAMATHRIVDEIASLVESEGVSP